MKTPLSPRIMLVLALPALVVAVGIGAGVALILLSGNGGAPWPWLLLVLATICVGAASTLALTPRLTRLRQRPIELFVRQIRHATVNQQFDPGMFDARREEFAELAEELNRLFAALAARQQEQARTRAEMRERTEATETALQLEVDARKSAQEKLQKLARELELSNRQLNDSLEQSLSADKAKAEFLSTMSHEIRTPLNAVLGVASLLDRSSLNERQRQQVGMIFESGKALLRILNDIMDYVRIEAGEMELDSFPCNLYDTLNTVFNRHAELAHARGLKYTFQFAESLPKLFLSDGARLQQLVNNLIDNAVKFTHDGAVSISVSGVALQHFRYLVRIEVRDTGIGIAPERRHQLFNVFSQGDSSITRAYGGSGMGLAICQRLVNLMQGSIGVESEPGEGSLFWVEIPLRVYQDLTLSEPGTTV